MSREPHAPVIDASSSEKPSGITDGSEQPRPPQLPDTITWPTSVAADDLSGQKLVTVLFLYLYPALWIHRRVETVKFDSNEACRYESVDFSLPPELVDALHEAEPELESLFIPLSFLDKTPLADLNIWDAADRRLCTLTKRQNERRSQILLTFMAKAFLGDNFTPSVERHLNAVITSDEGDELKSLANFWNSGDHAQQLFIDPVVGPLLHITAMSRPLFVPVRVTKDRQLVKYSYATKTGITIEGDYEETTLEPPSLGIILWTWLKRQYFNFRWWHQRRRFDISRAVLCDSYHFEIIAPAGFWIREDSVKVLEPHPDGSSTDWRFSGTVFKTLANIYLSQEGDEPPKRDMRVEFGLRLPRSGTLNFAFLSTFLTTVVLLVIGLTAKHLLKTQAGISDTSAGAAALLALVQLSTIWLSRPGDDHKAYANMLVGLRVLLLGSALAGFTGIILLLERIDTFLPGWSAVSGLAALSWLGIAVGWILTGRDSDSTWTPIKASVACTSVIAVASLLFAWRENTRGYWLMAVVVISVAVAFFSLKYFLARFWRPGQSDHLPQ